MFAEATKKAAAARFKQPATDAEGQEIEVSVPTSTFCLNRAQRVARTGRHSGGRRTEREAAGVHRVAAGRWLL